MATTKFLDKSGLEYYNSKLDTKFLNKQDKLTAGTGINISDDNVISADLKIHPIYEYNHNYLVSSKSPTATYNEILSLVNAHALGKPYMVNCVYESSYTIDTGLLSILKVTKSTNYAQVKLCLSVNTIDPYVSDGSSSSYGQTIYPNIVAKTVTFYVKRDEYDKGQITDIYTNTACSTSVSSLAYSKVTRGYYFNTPASLGINNTTYFSPTSDYQPATKAYVDSKAISYTAGSNILIEEGIISANIVPATISDIDLMFPDKTDNNDKKEIDLSQYTLLTNATYPGETAPTTYVSVGGQVNLDPYGNYTMYTQFSMETAEDAILFMAYGANMFPKTYENIVVTLEDMTTMDKTTHYIDFNSSLFVDGNNWAEIRRTWDIIDFEFVWNHNWVINIYAKEVIA